MPQPASPRRAAWAVFVPLLVFLCGALGTAVWGTQWAYRQAEQLRAQDVLTGVGAVLGVPSPAARGAQEAALQRATKQLDALALVMLDAAGQPVLLSDRSAPLAVPTKPLLDLTAQSAFGHTTVTWGDRPRPATVYRLPGTDYRLVLVAREVPRLLPVILPVLLVGLLLAMFILTTTWFRVSRAVAAPFSYLAHLARHLTSEMLPARRAELEAEATATIGEGARPLFLMAGTLELLRERLADAQSQVGALFQINPNYVLLVTRDGKVVEANPAFYAMSGMPVEAVRGNHISVLRDVMPIEPLMEMAGRAQAEGSVYAGIEHLLRSRDDKPRPVKIALRSVRALGVEAVLIMATDVTHQRTLERQISTFADSLDLMVDKRVAELTSGHEQIDQLVADAGVVLATFDRSGTTRRWNEKAAALTGRALAEVSHASDLALALGLTEADRHTFEDWLWGDAEGTCLVTVRSRGQQQPYVWSKRFVHQGEHLERCVLVAMPAPAVASAAPSAPIVLPSDELDDETRTSLQVLCGYATLLTETPEEAWSAETRRYIHMIQAAASQVEQSLGSTLPGFKYQSPMPQGESSNAGAGEEVTVLAPPGTA